MKNKATKIPDTLWECTAVDPVVEELRGWAERIREWGKKLFVILLVVGVVMAIVECIGALDTDYEDMMFSIFISTLFTWILYAAIEFCACYVISLLISALATITQNTAVTAKVALLQASKNPDIPKPMPEPVPKKKAPVKAEPATKKNDTAQEKKAVDFSTYYSAEKAPEPPKSFAEHLRYALQFQTDDGLRRYLNGLSDLNKTEQEDLKKLLSPARTSLRDAVAEYLEEE